MADAARADAGPAAGAPAPHSVGAAADLYLGNILFALERCALSLDESGLPEDAAFYRGIGRKLAEARAEDRAVRAHR